MQGIHLLAAVWQAPAAQNTKHQNLLIYNSFNLFQTFLQALAAINTLNGVELGGRTILVREDREDRDGKQVGAGWLPPAYMCTRCCLSYGVLALAAAFLAS